MSLFNTHTKLTGHPMEVALSPEILGRVFNGVGQPIDGLGNIVAETKRISTDNRSIPAPENIRETISRPEFRRLMP
jgi:V/A-type H+-transporting ATPase subunit B